jgi:hypothetical protein
LLGGLVAASEEEKKNAALEGVVDAVAGTEVDPEFGDAISQVPVGTGVSVNEPIDTNENPRATVFVCVSVSRSIQRLNSSVFSTRMVQSVAYRLQAGQASRQPSFV